MTKTKKREEIENTPIGKLSIPEIVKFCGEEELLDEISESAIADAISPSDYMFHHNRTDILDDFSSEELLDECSFDDIMAYAQKEGDPRVWLDTHPKGSESSVSLADATIPLIRIIMETVRPYALSLSKKEVIEELTTLVNDWWR